MGNGLPLISTQAATEPSSATAVVTGGTAGIGKAIARTLVQKGVNVLIVGSNAEKGKVAAKEISRCSGGASVEFVQTDLSLIRNVYGLAERIKVLRVRINYLVLCAGIMKSRFTVTQEGHEANFAVNYLSRFALTDALLPNLVATASGQRGKILIVGGAAQNGRIHFEDVNLTHGFNMLRMVSQFCEANDVFVIELARRLAAVRPSPALTVATLKVGVVRTEIRREFPLWMKLAVPLLDPFVSSTPKQIAASALNLLLAPEFENANGVLFRHIRRFKRLEPAIRTSDPDQGSRLWELSKRLVARSLGGEAPDRFLMV
jgi:NAD(P)-dependent dehydrogenase (short-subunit alcohol dehydrogenase family)